jgi:hypothetical protein
MANALIVDDDRCNKEEVDFAILLTRQVNIIALSVFIIPA